jgi:hypothetical protein
MIIHTMPQRSEAWYAIRSGKFTASDFETLMPSSRQGVNDFNKTQMAIIYRVAAERMTGLSVSDGYVSKAMQHGIDTEEEARVSFMLETGLDVQEVGFIEYNEWVGCSPDGLDDEPAGLEIKCPNSDTHLRYIMNMHELVDDYRFQCVGGMLCTGYQKWHLYSYDPRFEKESMRSVHAIIRHSDDEIARLEARLEAAIEKVKEIIYA